MPFDLLCAIKKVRVDGPVFDCNMFLLQENLDIIDKVVEHRRVGADNKESLLGKFKILSISNKNIVLHRLEGEEFIKSHDVIYLERQITQQLQSNIILISGYGFDGKNWKLASAKKWVKKQFERPCSPPLGTVTFDTVAHDVHKIDSGFVAVPQTQIQSES